MNTALRRISSSEIFRLAHQQREFLRFLVNRLNATSVDELKESVIGMEFFGRKAGYDPKADPIVRVEAHRLRRRLESFYRSEGARDPWRIVLGKGNYIPALQAATGARADNILAVIVNSDDELTTLGMTAELVRRLGTLKDIRVLAAQSVHGAQGDVATAIHELGADLVLECCIKGAIIHAQLKRVKAEGLELIGSFDNQIQSARDMIEMFVASTLDPGRRGRSQKFWSQMDRETYQIYLSGRGWFHRWSPDNLSKAMEHFEAVLNRYPSYAPAMAGLADCEVLRSYWYARETRKSLENGFGWASKALELDPDSSEAHCSLAACQIGLHHDWASAEHNFRIAVRQNPSYSLGHNWLSIICLVPLRRFDEAIDAVFEAYDLDPVSPEIGNEIVWVRICCRQFAESADQGRRMIAQHPNFIEAYWSLGLAESAQDNHVEARHALQVAEDLAPLIPHTIAWRGYAEARAGDRAAALRYLERLDALANSQPVRPIHYAWIYAGLRENDPALTYFEKALSEADPFTLYADVFFLYSNLRSDERFQRVRAVLCLPA